ncbi:MAG: helix-turn-helix domain-containing protein [Haloarculaceae archaeon]
MSVIATVEVDASDFVLEDTLAADPDLRIRLEHVVPIGDSIVPYLWIDDDRVEDIQAALDGEENVDSFRILDEANGEALVRVDWAQGIDGLFDAITENGGTVLEGVGERETWRFDLRFEGHDQLTAFYQRCADTGISIALQSVHNPGIPQDVGIEYDLTEAQRETLRTALDRGYFDVPRRTNLVELAERIGISDSAVSQRLRRGTKRILAASLFDAEESTDDD